MSLESERGSTLGTFDPERVAVFGSEAMRSVLEEIRTVAGTDATVLLTGETGVGKGVAARLIHQWSRRADQPFVGVHCGAIPDTLIESELFGHERGSFTGAHRRKRGEFELADQGTLFLDEIGTLTPAAQIKLLDVLQERRFHRVGGEKDIKVDVRIIAASNKNFEAMIDGGLFRSDLFYRLSVFPIEVPPLRHRQEDLPHLVSQILKMLDRRYGKRIESLEPAVEQAFQSYPWPGNVRELENVLERAVILESSSRIGPKSIAFEILDQAETFVVVPVAKDPGPSLAGVRAAAVRVAEQRYLERILATQKGRIDATAEIAGISTRQLHKLLAKHGIDKAAFKPSSASLGQSDLPRSVDHLGEDEGAGRSQTGPEIPFRTIKSMEDAQ